MPLIPIIDEAKVKKLTDEPKFGTVVDNNDPDQLGKIKVVIPGIFEGTTETLPWIRRKQDTSFCGLDCEIFDVPALGSIVEIKWNYDENTPMYSGAPFNIKKEKQKSDDYINEGYIRFGKNYLKFNKEKPEIIITNESNKIVLNPEGITDLYCKNLRLHVEETTTLDCPLTTITGDVIINKTLQVDQTTNANVDSTANGISLVKHTHKYTQPAHPGGTADTDKPTK